MSNNTNWILNILGKDKTKKAFASIKRSMGGMRKAVNSTQAKVAVLGGGAALTGLVAQSLRVQDALAKTSDRLNIATEDLAALQHMAELNGSSTETANKSLEKMNRSLGEASRGTGTAARALKEMGIDIKDLSKLDAGEQFTVIAENIKNVEDATLQASYAADIFGRGGVEMLNTLNQGAEGFAAAKKEAQELGIAVTRIDAAKAEMANDAILRAKKVFSGFGNSLTNHVGPIIESITQGFVDTAKEAGGMNKFVAKVFKKLVNVVGIFADGLHGIKVIFKGLQTIGFGLGAGLVTVFTKVVEAVVGLGNTIKNALLFPIRKTLELASRFSDDAKLALDSLNEIGADFKAPEALTKATDYMMGKFQTQQVELQQLLMQKIPSEVLKGKVDKILADAEVRAQVIADKATKKKDGADEDASDTPEYAATDAELESVRQKYANKLMLLDEWQANEQTMVEAALAKKKLTYEEYAAAIDKINDEHAAKKAKLEQTSQKFSFNTMVKGMGDILKGFGIKSKKMQKIQQAASIFNAIVSGKEAAVAAWKAGMSTGGPWAPAVAAAYTAASLAKTGAMIAGIKSSSQSSGAGAGGGGSSMPSYNAPVASSPNFGSQFAQNDSGNQPLNQIQIRVDTLIGDNAETVAHRIKDYLDESDFVLVDPNSRNGIELGSVG